MNKRLWIILLTIIAVAIIIKLKVPLVYDGEIYLLFLIAMEVAELSMFVNTQGFYTRKNLGNFILLYNELSEVSISHFGTYGLLVRKGVFEYRIKDFYDLSYDQVLDHIHKINEKLKEYPVTKHL